MEKIRQISDLIKSQVYLQNEHFEFFHHEAANLILLFEQQIKNSSSKFPLYFVLLIKELFKNSDSRDPLFHETVCQLHYQVHRVLLAMLLDNRFIFMEKKQKSSILRIMRCITHDDFLQIGLDNESTSRGRSLNRKEFLSVLWR